MKPAVSSGTVLRFGLFEANVANNTLTRQGVRVRIQDKPFRALILLLENPGKIVTREELRHTLWPEGTYVDFDGSLNVVLKKLRASIDDDSDNPRFVETVPRRGYRFIAPVSVEAKESASDVSKAVADGGSTIGIPQSAAASDRGLTVDGPGRRLSLLQVYGAGIVLLLAIGVGWFALHKKHSVGLPLKVNAQVALRRSVAVLGFHNVSGRPDDAWLSTAFSEMLSTELAGGDKLRLVSGEEVANLRLSSPWPQTDSLDRSTTARLGTALNADLLVLGSYTTLDGGNRGSLRLDVRLQDAKTGEILTEIAQTGDRQELFQLVSGVGANLRSRLGVPRLEEPQQATVMASMPTNREAARLYSLGLVKLREFDALAAKDLLQQACNADPKFALGHAMFARAWSQLGYEQKRKEEAKKALDLSGTLSHVDRMQVEGDYYESLSDHEKAASTYRAMFELFPDNVEYGLQLASAEYAAGHANQASAVLAQLRHLLPAASDDPRIDLLDARVGPTNDPARLVLIRSAERKAAAQGKKLVYAQARKEECENLNYSDHPADAPPACEDAYNIYLAAGNRLGAADSIRLLGDTVGARGDMEQAIATYQRAFNILQELGEHSKTGALLNNMAVKFANEGKLERAEKLYRQAQFHFAQAGDKGHTATELANIADILFLRGDLAGAAKMYQQALDIETSLDHGSTGYPLYRLADLNLVQGHVPEAHRLAQEGIDALRAKQGGYVYVTEAMIELGEILKAEANLSEAHQQFQSARETEQKLGDKSMVAESEAELAELALEEGHPNEAESLIRPAIAEFEQEKGDPALAGAYTVLSRALLALRKLEEARTAAQQASWFSRMSSDPALRFPAAIQQALVEAASAGRDGRSSLEKARAELHSTIARAKKLGYHELECEGRLALGEVEMKRSPAEGRAELTALAAEARRQGLELLARKAEQTRTGTSLMAASAAPR
jgi:eukaryotic-like serine/threonine-protein kinase